MIRKLTRQELVARQAVTPPKLPFSVVVNNIRSLFNVGSLFRTADGAGVEKIWLCGITGIPPDEKISKTALGAEKTVPWEFSASARSCVESLKSKGYQIVLLEQTVQSIPYQHFEPDPQRPVCLVLGNEISGVSDPILPLCDVAIEIEMAGLKNSLNVTVAFGIVAYHIRSKILENIRDRSLKY